MKYEDFNIRINKKRPDGGFDISVESPAGNASEHIKLPFEVADAMQRIRDIGGSIRSGGTREASFEAEETTSPAELGAELYQALFSGKVGKMYNRSYAALSDPDAGLRIKLHLNLDDPGVSELSQLPWEYVYEADTMEYLTLSRQTPIIRYIEVQRSQTSHALPVDLRILVVISSPNGVQALDLEKERKLIEDSWANEENVTVDFLEHPTPDSLLDALVQNQYHVLHYMGHGAYDHISGAGALILEDENHDAVMLDAQALGTWIRDEPTIRLVFLNACDTARVDEDEPFAGVANRLVMAGVPAVLAMQFPISDEAAIDFARAFYPRLVAGYPVDEATSQGRKAILAGKTGTVEWATPVLSMRLPDGLIFDETRKTPPPDPAPPVPPPSPDPVPPPPPPPDPVNYTKWIGGGIAAVAVVAIAWFIVDGLKPSGNWELKPLALEVGKPTTISVDLIEAEGKSSYSEDYELRLTGSGAVSVPDETPEAGTWEWTATATDVGSGNLRLEVSDANDEDKEPFDFEITTKINDQLQKTYDDANGAIADPAATTANVVAALASLGDQKSLLSPAMGALVDENYKMLSALLETRAKEDAASLDEESTLSERIAALTRWKTEFERVRYSPGDDAEDHLLARLSDYNSRSNAEQLILCDDQHKGCTESTARLRQPRGLFVYVNGITGGTSVQCKMIHPRETRDCWHNDERNRNLNQVGIYNVEVRNTDGDLLLRQAIESL